MVKKDNKFLQFIDNTPNAFCCVNNLKEILNKEGFIELYENEIWSNLKTDGKYYVSRNDSSLIAFKMTNNFLDVGFNITATHTDSPSFTIKPNPDIYENGYFKFNIDNYGGGINYSWLDRPLSIAGRVITRQGDTYKKHIINIDKDLLIIPSQAIHINRDVNTKNELNQQVDMLPIMSLSEHNSIMSVIGEELRKNLEFDFHIYDYDLYLYNRDKARYVGIKDEFISAPRLDDLGSVYPAFHSFIDSENKNSFNVFCAFNNEEIGSLTMQGADSTFLIDVLTRIAGAAGIDLLTALSNSMVVSADNAHAVHPNAPSKSDPTNKVYLNNGVVIKHHTNYTTDALTSSLFKGLCRDANIPYQDFASRADLKCGWTLGGINQSHVSCNSIDIGLPQLAMHSANELIGSKDIYYMYKSLLEFYKTSFVKEKNMIKIKK